MSHAGRESQGTGLRDVFDILVKAPSERLLSLTIQLGDSPEDTIIHALCLIVLQREAQALDRLHMLKDNSLANHLAEQRQASGGELEDFGVHCGHFQALTGECLEALARIFNVLSEQRLCNPHLRNLAYKRALSCDCPKTTTADDLEYDQFREEAKAVCGPQVAEWMSPTDLRSGSYLNPHRSLDEGQMPLKVSVSQDQSASTRCLPSPLQASPSVPSYPSHLEISFPPTASFQGDRIAPEVSGTPRPDLSIPPVGKGEETNAPGQSQSSGSSACPLFGAMKDPTMDETSAAMSGGLDSHVSLKDTPNQANKPSPDPKSVLPTAANPSPPTMPATSEAHESKGAEDEEENVFYAFVIFHAPEDADMAVCLKEKLESVIRSDGATFSEDFAIPGRSTLRCVADAIDNSAFTFLLLSRNFNTRMLEMKTNSALINSINNQHKYNTVIPLLPRENCMPRRSIPLALQTLIPLVENSSFERKIQKSLTPAKIEKQRRIWAQEQIQIQERLRRLKLQERMTLCMEQNLVLGPGVPPEQDGGDGRALWPPQRNICIQNAKYIMIGNDSTMTVDLGGSAAGDDSQEEQ